MKIYYKSIIDEKPVEVEIIQTHKKRVEIIRKSRIGNRKKYAGFWVDKKEVLNNQTNHQ